MSYPEPKGSKYLTSRDIHAQNLYCYYYPCKAQIFKFLGSWTLGFMTIRRRHRAHILVANGTLNSGGLPVLLRFRFQGFGCMVYGDSLIANQTLNHARPSGGCY